MRHKISVVALRGEAGETRNLPRRCVCRGRRERKREGGMMLGKGEAGEILRKQQIKEDSERNQEIH